MRLREGENIIKILKRHPTPFVIKLFEVLLIALPLYALLIYISRLVPGIVTFVGFLIVSFFLSVFLMYIAMDYLLDRLVVTNRRLLCINWKTPFRREEQETELMDIQHIDTHEKGILSSIPIFNYGTLNIESAASKTTILFYDAPDPRQAKFIILSEIEKHEQSGGHRSIKKNQSVEEESEKPVLVEDDWSVN